MFTPVTNLLHKRGAQTLLTRPCRNVQNAGRIINNLREAYLGRNTLKYCVVNMQPKRQFVGGQIFPHTPPSTTSHYLL